MDASLTNPGKWGVRASIAGLLAVLCFLTGLSVLIQRHSADLSKLADQANRISSLYQDVRFHLAQEQALERKYRLEPDPQILAQHLQAEQSLGADLRGLQAADPTAAMKRVVTRLLELHASYDVASSSMFQAIDFHDPQYAIQLDHVVVDPVVAEMQAIVFRNAGLATRRSLADSASLRRQESAATRMIGIAFGIGIALVVLFWFIIARFRGRLDAARAAEVERLAEIALIDPLTGLRNHRTFHDDLARSLHRVGRTGVPLSLVMLDLDQLKEINDAHGHRAGDECLRTLTAAILACERGSDGAYRIGGDEFAVILDDTRAWGAVEYVQRLMTNLLTREDGVSVSVSAGISEACGFGEKDALIHEADLALLASKRSGRGVTVYAADLEPEIDALGAGDNQRYTQTLASALARAVDAKDSYTRSHSQTVSELCGLIARQLGFDPERLARIRLAGLLHDVGKIGIPDAILNKPGKLTDDEYTRMQTHSLLGYEIISAADLPAEATWVRHHHERYDGRGYPDGLCGEQIPLESRVILVADAFEAMTSDRPYRKAPGQEYALEELRRHAGSQFDAEVVDALVRLLEHGRVDEHLGPSGSDVVHQARA